MFEYVTEMGEMRRTIRYLYNCLSKESLSLYGMTFLNLPVED